MIPYYPPDDLQAAASFEPTEARPGGVAETGASKGHKVWMGTAERGQSPQVQFGSWWEMDGTLWRVSWLERTGELYATELKPTDRFVVLGHFTTRKDLRQAMAGWFGGNNLPGLIHRLDRLAHGQVPSNTG